MSTAQDANTRQGFVVAFSIGVVAISVVFLTHTLPIFGYTLLAFGGMFVFFLLLVLPRRFELHEESLVVVSRCVCVCVCVGGRSGERRWPCVLLEESNKCVDREGVGCESAALSKWRG